MAKRIYNGIELEGLDKEVRMAHSRLFDRSVGTDWLDRLLDTDKARLSPRQFGEVSALASVAAMNYQVCNGGLEQYFTNGYHKAREPFDPQDTRRLGKAAQADELRELAFFGRAAFPERAAEAALLDRVIGEFDAAAFEDAAEWEEADEWGEWSWEEAEPQVIAEPGFDSRYYQVNEYLELLIEAYAQYLLKSLGVAE